MSRSLEETRRTFLLRLARTAAFVPPAMATLDVSPLSAGGRPGAAAPVATQQTQTTTAPVAQQQAVVGTLSPTAAAIQAEPAQIQLQDGGAVPWNPGSTAAPAPWSQPPPTQTGG